MTPYVVLLAEPITLKVLTGVALAYVYPTPAGNPMLLDVAVPVNATYKIFALVLRMETEVLAAVNVTVAALPLPTVPLSEVVLANVVPLG